MENYEDKQTLYKNGDYYYEYHANILRQKNYKMIEDTKEYSVFILLKQDIKSTS